MSTAASECDPDVALALVCALADTLVVPIFMQLLQPHEHLVGMSAAPPPCDNALRSILPWFKL